MRATKGVRVHVDTHAVLKLIKEQRRSKSMDEVIRDLVKGATGKSISQFMAQKENSKITTFIQ